MIIYNIFLYAKNPTDYILDLRFQIKYEQLNNTKQTSIPFLVK